MFVRLGGLYWIYECKQRANLPVTDIIPTQI